MHNPNDTYTTRLGCEPSTSEFGVTTGLNEQSGFCKIHSADLAAMDLVESITNHMKKGNTSMTEYLSKTFDTLNYCILINKRKYYDNQ